MLLESCDCYGKDDVHPESHAHHGKDAVLLRSSHHCGKVTSVNPKSCGYHGEAVVPPESL